MRILIMSDSHGNIPLTIKACEMAETFDCLLHLGDGADDAAFLEQALEVMVIHVAGNCDIGSTSPRELLWECEGKRLLLVHGDAYGVKSGLGRLETRAIAVGADAVLFGHTHRATVTTLSGILAVNPGTLMRKAQHTSFAILEISPAGISARLHDIS
ncbi:MAG: metallophosphoesterase [Desulfuromonadales bacterium]|nr:metallophosphoesterase [Desulfuromonadales bacterium]